MTRIFLMILEGHWQNRLFAIIPLFCFVLLYVSYELYCTSLYPKDDNLKLDYDLRNLLLYSLNGKRQEFSLLWDEIDFTKEEKVRR